MRAVSISYHDILKVRAYGNYSSLTFYSGACTVRGVLEVKAD